MRAFPARPARLARADALAIHTKISGVIQADIVNSCIVHKLYRYVYSNATLLQVSFPVWCNGLQLAWML